jgi:hypothetical protein
VVEAVCPPGTGGARRYLVGPLPGDVVPVGPIQLAAHTVQEVNGSSLGYLRVDGSQPSRPGESSATSSVPPELMGACSVPFAAHAVVIGIQAKWVGRTY